MAYLPTTYQMNYWELFGKVNLKVKNNNGI